MPSHVERVDVSCLSLDQPLAAGQRDEPGTQFGCGLRGRVAQKPAHAIGLVFGHQRRAMTGDPFADRGQLVKTSVRGQRDVAVGEHIRPQHAARDHRDERHGSPIVDRCAVAPPLR